MPVPASIRVTLIDADNGRAIGEVDLSPSRLPARFDVATTLHIADDPWEVVLAEPATAETLEGAEGYLVQGAVRLTVRLVGPALTAMDSVAPHRAPFRRASLVDPLPGLTESPVELPQAPVLELTEDEWRQIELVSLGLRAMVTLELAAVTAVARRAEVPGGYAAVHVRRVLDAPLAGVSLSLGALRGAFRGPLRAYAGVGFRGREGTVREGFAFETAGGLTVYGITSGVTEPGGSGSEDTVTVLALRPDRARRGPPVDAPALASLRRTHGLLLVDWEARVSVPPRAGDD